MEEEKKKEERRLRRESREKIDPRNEFWSTLSLRVSVKEARKTETESLTDKRGSRQQLISVTQQKKMFQVGGNCPFSYEGRAEMILSPIQPILLQAMDLIFY